MQRFEEIPHTADWSFRAFGKDVCELFENAAHAIFALEGAPTIVISRESFDVAQEKLRDREIPQSNDEISRHDAARNDMENFVVRPVDVTGIDYESLLVNWLTELLWLQESNRETYHRFQIETLTTTILRAQVFGAPMTRLNKVIKAVTYHNLKVEQTADGWQATVVVDV